MQKNNIKIDRDRNDLLSWQAHTMLEDRYLLDTEDAQDMFARVASAFADDNDHAQRMYDLMSTLIFMPATPILSNGGTEKGLPISCFVNEVMDDLTGIQDSWNENINLASKGGGIGTCWSNVRSVGERIGDKGTSSGIIPFIKVQDSLTLAISQGSLRRGSTAVYLHISHPEIEEFLDLRKPTGGDPNRRSLNIHHGVVIPDAFMVAVENNGEWSLLSPKDQSVLATVKARYLWEKLLIQRLETGEPYIVWEDNVNDLAPESYQELGLKVKTSNLCSEITLATGEDCFGSERTAVCCLGSLNLKLFDKIKKEDIRDCLHFLDNVLSHFIKTAPKGFKNAVYSAKRERSIGLGVMGFHSYLQEKEVPIDSLQAKFLNKRIFNTLKNVCDTVSEAMGRDRGSCLDYECIGERYERFTHKTTIAPTASISTICGVSPSCDPVPANAYINKNLSGSFLVKNPTLEKHLKKVNLNTEETWRSIVIHEGSVQHLNLSNETKSIFRTSFELNQQILIDLAIDRVPLICQAQSLNLFLSPTCSKKELHNLHMSAWKGGVKTLYYCRSKSIGKAEVERPSSECNFCQ